VAMDEFIREHIKDLKRTPNVRLPKPAQCMIVTQIAPRSLAGHAGIAAKDLLVSLDGSPPRGSSPRPTCTAARSIGGSSTRGRATS